MNLLTEQLPRAVIIDGEEYKIRWDFKTSVCFEILMQDEELSDDEKIVRSLALYYPEIPPNIPAAIEQLLEFYRCGKKEEAVQTAEGTGRTQEPIYSFEYDHEYIYAAFLDQYGIDLQHDSLHWWVFRALFRALRGDHQIVKIMEYRSIQITSEMTNEQKSFYRNMKQLYQIPASKLAKQKVNAIEEALLGDGDLTKVL